MTAPSPLAGGCLCGAVRYQADAEPMAVLICHCSDCQRQSGAPFSLNVVIDHGSLQFVSGETRTHVTHGGDEGRSRERIFCPQCGSPLVTTIEEMPDLAVIKAGTLDDRGWLEPELEIYTDSAQPWFHAAEAPERGLFPGSLPS
jgi:hypothetical protein